MTRSKSGEVADSATFQSDPLASDCADDRQESECMPPKGAVPSQDLKATASVAF